MTERKTFTRTKWNHLNIINWDRWNKDQKTAITKCKSYGRALEKARILKCTDLIVKGYDTGIYLAKPDMSWMYLILNSGQLSVRTDQYRKIRIKKERIAGKPILESELARKLRVLETHLNQPELTETLKEEIRQLRNTINGINQLKIDKEPDNETDLTIRRRKRKSRKKHGARKKTGRVRKEI